VVGFPKIDAATGDLHLVTAPEAGVQFHVTISAGALTRTARPVAGGPARVHDLAIAGDRVVFAARGFVGLGPHGGNAYTTWHPGAAGVTRLLDACEVGSSVAVLALTPSLESWTIDRGASPAVQRTVIDAAHHDLAYVPDPARASQAHGGWLVGFVQDPTTDETAVVVLDAANLPGPAMATVRLPRRIPATGRASWIPRDGSR
jgi:carotenoid cleavage dioxygenase-like enzyme